MKFSGRVRQEVEVNLTPLIDVVFLLLIFFMVSTTFTKETHLSIDLPEASSQSIRAKDLQIEILSISGSKNPRRPPHPPPWFPPQAN